MSEDKRLRTWKFLYYAQALAGVESFTAPILIIFYLDYCGYSFKEYGFLLSAIAITLWLLEVPMGALADRFGRKLCLICGNLMYVGALSALVIFKRDLPIVLLAVLFAVGKSAANGTFQSMMYQVFREARRPAEFHSTNAHGTSLAHLGGALAAILGGWLGDHSLMLPMLVDIGALLLVTLLLVVRLKEPPAPKQEVQASQGFFQIIETGVRQATATRTMVILIFCAAISFACVRAGFNLYQPLLSQAGISLTKMGIYFSGFSFFSAFVAYWFGHIKKKVLYGPIPILLIACTFGLAAVVLTQPFAVEATPVVLAILCHQAARGIFPSYFSFAINQRVPPDSASRTTVLSLSSLVRALVSAGVLAGVGFLGEDIGYAMTFILLSGLSAVTLIFLVGHKATRPRFSESSAL